MLEIDYQNAAVVVFKLVNNEIGVVAMVVSRNPSKEREQALACFRAALSAGE